MQVRVLLFAGLRQRAGTDHLDVEIHAGASVSALKKSIATLRPDLAQQLDICRVAVDCEFRDDTEAVLPNCEVALIPPVSGGHDNTQAAPHCLLTAQALELDRVVAAVAHEGAGGITSFVGNVRRQSRGKVVSFLEYEAYGTMAVSEMERIAVSIEARYLGARVCIHHRTGRLEIGEAAVIIAASAAHRAEAFSACRDAIEALKADVPIWKREVDDQGEEWIGHGP